MRCITKGGARIQSSVFGFPSNFPFQTSQQANSVSLRNNDELQIFLFVLSFYQYVQARFAPFTPHLSLSL